MRTRNLTRSRKNKNEKSLDTVQSQVIYFPTPFWFLPVDVFDKLLHSAWIGFRQCVDPWQHAKPGLTRVGPPAKYGISIHEMLFTIRRFSSSTPAPISLLFVYGLGLTITCCPSIHYFHVRLCVSRQHAEVKSPSSSACRNCST